MALSAFDDRSRPPQEEDLSATLGPAFTLWNELRRRLAAALPPFDEVWGFASTSTGWGLRIATPRRTILYMTPRQGHFLASFAIGEKAARAAQAAGLAAPVLAAIDGARRYGEGRAVRLEVREDADVPEVVKLAQVKMAN